MKTLEAAYEKLEDTQEATLLEDAFDLEEVLAQPGLYVAAAGTDAYPILAAVVAAEAVQLVGERYMENGQKVITVLSGDGTDGEHYQANPAIGIGREFFVTALKDYRNWEEKWWREVIQNAIDADATKLHLDAVEQDDGTWLVSCLDNGAGMTEDVLVNKFLVLGGTTKTGASGTAGGFGKAKELLVLPWLSWEIHTQNTRVRGSGIEYEVEAAEHLDGTLIQVRMAADQHTYAAPAINFIKKCYLPDITFYVNGERVKADLKTKSGPIKELAGKALAYFIKSDTHTSQMLIRVGGSKFEGSLFMFERWLSEGIKGYVIIELLGPSIALMTANRDDIRDYELKQSLDKLGNEIAADVTSALKAKAGIIRKKYVGSGKFTPETRHETEANLILAAGTLVGQGEFSDAAVEQVAEIIDKEWDVREDEGNVGAMSGELAKLLMTLKMRGESQAEACLKQFVWQPDFYLVNEIENFKIPSKFTPENMTPTVLKLIKTWTEFCRFVLVQLGSPLPFGVGFQFSEQTAASYMEDKNEHWLMLNPIYEGEQLNPADHDDLNLLYEFAIHEATHMADGISYHNEAFAAALTFNNARCANGWKKIRQIAGTIKMREQKEFEEESELE